jgi:hypothetical protein
VRRILIVTVGLMATGALVGAILGALSLWLATAIRAGVVNVSYPSEILGAGALAGALMGSVLAPITAWSLMRFVPLWRAIGESALATVTGAIVGTLAGPAIGQGLVSSIVGGLLGFLLAAVHLRIVYGRKSADKESNPTG